MGRKIVNIFCTIVITVSAVLYGTSLFCEHVFQHDLTRIVSDQMKIEENIEEMFSYLSPFFDEGSMQKAKDLEKKIVNDETLQTTLYDISLTFMEDLTSESKQQYDHQLNQIVKDTILYYEKDIQNLTGDLFTSKQIQDFVSESISVVDPQGAYDIVITETRKQLTTEQTAAIKMIDELQKEQFRTFVIVAMVLFFILLLIINRHHHLGFMYISISFLLSGLILFLSGRFACDILIERFKNFEALIGDIRDSASVMTTPAYIYLGIGVATGFMALLLHHKKDAD